MTDQDGRLVSVVVPAHNEEATVARFVERTAKAFAQLGRPWELLYVDDGSTDGTAAAVEAAARAEPRVRLVRQRRNLGLTEALNRGFREANGEVIVFLPADLESDPEVDVPLLLDKLDEGYDVVAGWRQGRRDGKRFASRLANVTCRVLFGLDVHDMNWIKSFLSSHTQYRPLMLVAGIAMLAGLLVILVGFLAELVVNVSERVERLERRLEDDADR